MFRNRKEEKSRNGSNNAKDRTTRGDDQACRECPGATKGCIHEEDDKQIPHEGEDGSSHVHLLNDETEAPSDQETHLRSHC